MLQINSKGCLGEVNPAIIHPTAQEVLFQFFADPEVR
jgi:hypothetical protein